MASSDEEGEIIPDFVTNFHFVNDKEEPVRFSMLPLLWSNEQMSTAVCPEIFLQATADSGLQQIYKKIIAWKFELSFVLPEIYVLSKDQIWIQLHKPRKSYEEMIRTILVTIHFLHFVKKSPRGSRDTIWSQMLGTFRTFEVPPSENDLFDHMLLINEATLRDKDIAESEYMATFLSKMRGTGVAANEETQAPKKLKFVVDGNFDEHDADGDGEVDEEKEELFDSVCAYCDDGGEILCCEGRCIRSFHPTIESGAESFCESLGYSHEQAEAIQTFLCKNCQHQMHQCFACGLLGSSDKSVGADVFPCISATCAHFYHPKCVSKLLFPNDEEKAECLQSKIAEGDSFACPMHKCFQCKQVEDKKVYELQFAICRRCPKAYHRKCLPRTIMSGSDKEKKIQRRAWEGLWHNRVLIYCMDHSIISKIGTPRRDHLVFPEINMKKKQYSFGSLSSEVTDGAGKRSKILGSLDEKPLVKVVTRPIKEIYSTIKVSGSVSEVSKGLPKKVCEWPRSLPYNSSTNNQISIIDNYKYPAEVKGKSSQKDDQLKSKKVAVPSGKVKSMRTVMPLLENANSAEPSGNAEIRKRVLALIKSSTASFNQEEFMKKKKRKSIQAHCSKIVEEKPITIGKVECTVKAIRAALKKIEDGGTIEDAKAVCEPEILNQILRWKRKLRVYLAPFLHGMRYTSFGRHFTKVDKLKEIVGRVQWYVKDGDMIVDFCCGSNDFSCLMKEALEKMGQKCSFKNYDLIQPKNVFCFERRDWMSVGVEELPAGPSLIMGLNPPFGVHAALANKFITKALQFRPRLLILIVPRETERLDKKKFPYDLIWEDQELLSGKSFYLPGSMDVHAQQLEQWNLEAPPLYLWSHPNWTAYHKAIAREHGHIKMEENVSHVMGMNGQSFISNYLMEDQQNCCNDFFVTMEGLNDVTDLLDDVPEDLDGNERDKKLKLDASEDSGLQMLVDYQPREQCLQADDEGVYMELSTPTNFPAVLREPAGSVEDSPPNATGVVFDYGNSKETVQPAEKFPSYLQEHLGGWLM